MEFLFIFVAIAFVGGGFFIFKSIKKCHNNNSTLFILIEYAFWLIYSISFLFFLYCTQGAYYSETIDPIDEHYEAFSKNHLLTLIVFLIAFLVACVLLRTKGKTLPPLTFVLCMIFILIGIVISIVVILHVSESDNNENPFLYPVLNVLIALWVLYGIISEEAQAASNRQYKNKTLSFLNKILTYGNLQLGWILVLLFPVFVIITLILTGLGQEVNSISKVFTDTTTWHFSQQTHPPYLDHSRHYLCTVAACGHPKIVKPVRMEKRHGHEIIVNRQLMIANAYEEMLQGYFPKIHRMIRMAYDRYGYPFSKHITTSFRSDLVYLVMKPLEWFFLIHLYLLCTNPEAKIDRQYQ